MAFSSCRDKVICPAFQSTYILDDSVRSIYYSYLWKLSKEERLKYLTSQSTSRQSYNELDTLGNPVDSLGSATVGVSGEVDYFEYVEKYIVPNREVKKSKYGIVKYEPYWLTNHRLRTAPMENVLAPEKPSVDTASTVDVGEFLASDFVSDTLSSDSTAIALNMDADSAGYVLPSLARAPPPPPKKETKYLYRYDPKDKALNVEQDYYNKYFGQLLVDNRPEPQPESIDTTALSSPEFDESDTSSFIEKKGFGVRLNFGKNRKNDSLEENTQEDNNEEDQANGTDIEEDAQSIRDKEKNQRKQEKKDRKNKKKEQKLEQPEDPAQSENEVSDQGENDF